MIKQIITPLIIYSDYCLATVTILAVVILWQWIREEIYKWGIGIK